MNQNESQPFLKLNMTLQLMFYNAICYQKSQANPNLCFETKTNKNKQSYKYLFNDILPINPEGTDSSVGIGGDTLRMRYENTIQITISSKK